MLVRFIAVGFSLGMGMWDCQQKERFNAVAAGLWFSCAAINIYYILEA